MAKKKNEVNIKVNKIDLEALDEPKHVSKSKKTSKTKKKDIKQAKHAKKEVIVIKNNKKNKVISVIMFIFFILCIFGMIWSGYKIYKWYSNNNDNKDIQEEINDKIKEEIDEKGNNVLLIDFDSLKSINKDTVAYIDYKQFGINYVVVQSSDNDYYLEHNFNRKWNEAGWIFADYNNKLDGTDKNIILYGHSMKNGSMFGSLHNILKDGNYKKEENQIIKFVTPDGTYNYKLFSVYTIEAEDYYITTTFKNDKDYKDYLNEMKKRSIYNYNIKVSEKDKILTLSTCQGYTGNKRLVIHAVKLKEE